MTSLSTALQEPRAALRGKRRERLVLPAGGATMLGRRGPCQPPRRGSLAALALAALCLWAACALGPAGATEAARCEVLLDGRMESIALIRISLRTFNHKPVLSLSWNGVLGVGTDAGKKLFFIIKVPGKTGYMFQVLCCYIVCQDFLERFYSSLKEKHSDFSMASIENELVRSCMNTKGKENRLCYYIGATSDAATKIMSEVSRPMSAHVPVPKICEKLKKIDVQICELKYERKLDLTSVDLSKMRVSELRKILDSWGEVCRACIEKTDFVDLIKELAPKHTAATSRADL